MGTDDVISTMSIADNIQTEADAYLFLEQLRWGTDNERQVCPKCGSTRRFYLIKNQKTRTGAATGRRRWKCADCRHQFSVLTGTIFHGTKIPVRKWVFVIYEMCASKNGVSAREIERKCGLTAKSAWFMLHRIREAMKRDPLAGLLSGRIVADETYVGGKPRNKPQQGKGRQPVGKGARGGQEHLTPS